jgi:hypothetical protein
LGANDNFSRRLIRIRRELTAHPLLTSHEQVRGDVNFHGEDKKGKLRKRSNKQMRKIELLAHFQELDAIADSLRAVMDKIVSFHWAIACFRHGQTVRFSPELEIERVRLCPPQIASRDILETIASFLGAPTDNGIEGAKRGTGYRWRIESERRKQLFKLDAGDNAAPPLVCSVTITHVLGHFWTQTLKGYGKTLHLRTFYDLRSKLGRKCELL